MAVFYYLFLVVLLHTAQAWGGNWPADALNQTNIKYQPTIEPNSNRRFGCLMRRQGIYGISNVRTNITDCPKTCSCTYRPEQEGNPSTFSITFCSRDPRPDLPKLFHLFHKSKLQLDELQFLYNTAMTSFPCEVTMLPLLVNLVLYDSSIPSVPCNLTGMYRLQELDLSSNRLKVLHPALLPPSLEYLFLDNNRLERILEPLSITLPNMQTLSLDYNRLTELPADLARMSSLTILRVRYNRIRRVNFMLLPRLLRELSLGNNEISAIHVSQPPPSITDLGLSHNRLGLVSRDLLSVLLVHSRYVDLSYNKLQALPRCSGPYIDYDVEWLDLSHNSIKLIPFQYASNFESLTQLSLDHNEISVIKHGAFSEPSTGLTYVGLSYNYLISLDSWPISIATQISGLHVHVEYNSISKFRNHYGIATNWCNWISLPSIFLQNNNITHLMDIFNGWNLKGNRTSDLEKCLDTISFGLRGNTLICDCVDYEIYKYLHKFNRRWDMLCSTPVSLSGKDPLDIPLDSFVCPIHKDCPPGCTCIMSPHTNSIQLRCENYTGMELPSRVPHLPTGSKYHLDFRNGNLNKVTFRAYLRKSYKAMFSNNAIVVVSRDALLALANVEFVQLDNNLLKSLSDDITSIILNSTRMMTLSKNRWHCNCPDVAMRIWVLKNGYKIPDSNLITCHSPSSTFGRKMKYLDEDVFCPKATPGPALPYVLPYILVGGAIVLFFIIIPVVIILKGVQHCRQTAMIDRPAFRPPPKDECENEDKEFDVYVSYDYRDEEYALKWLIPELEKRGFKVCFQILHADPCESEITNLFSCINRSKRVLVFFTYNLLDNNLSLNEWNTAYNVDINNGTTRLVTILDTDIDINYLEYIQMQYFAVRPSILRDERHFWQSLIYSLAIERMGKPQVVDDEGNELPTDLVKQE